MSNRVAVAGLVLLLIFVLVGIFGFLIQRYDPNAQVLSDRLQSPSAEHWLGTDRLGRDLYARLIESFHISLFAALEAVLIGVVIGVPLGLFAGFVAGGFDSVISRIADALLSIPGLILAVGVIGVLGPGLTNAMFAVGIILAPVFFRISRATAADLRRDTFIVASRSIGCSDTRLVWRHILPNVSGPLLVQISFAASVAIVAEASLSFLGLGVKTPQASFGSMVSDGYQTVNKTVWPMIPPSVAIMLVVLALFFVGDGLEAAVARQGARDE